MVPPMHPAISICICLYLCFVFVFVLNTHCSEIRTLPLPIKTLHLMSEVVDPLHCLVLLFSDQLCICILILVYICICVHVFCLYLYLYLYLYFV